MSLPATALIFFSRPRCQECGQATEILSSSRIPFSSALEKIDATGAWTGLYASRFSTAADISKEVPHEVDLISFIQSASEHAEGPCHCWLNRSEESKEFLRKDGAFLLLAEAFLEDSSRSPGDRIAMLKKVKFLQQRYPWLHVFGFQSGYSLCSTDDHNHLIHVIMEELISFPILLCSKTFPQMEKGPCWFLFKGLKGPPLCLDRDIDLSILLEAIKELDEQRDKKAGIADKLKSTWSKQTEGFREPYVCYSLRNLLLYLPACISADESGNRLFLSDSNHHRVIVFDSNGKILDMVSRMESLRLRK